MKYCFSFYKRSKYMDAVDELTIYYSENTIDLIKFAEKRPKEQRLIVAVDIDSVMFYDNEKNGDNEDTLNEMFEIFSAAMEKHPNIAFKILNCYSNYVLFKDKKLPFFFDVRCSTWQNVVDVCNTGVTDIYATNELGFDIIEVSTYCHARGVNVRTFPNVAQSSSYWGFIGMDEKYNDDDITKFFIRPEDLAIYEDYIDVVEFFGSLKDQDLVYEIYKSGKWLGKLGQIILGVKKDIYNRELSSMFAIRRLNCKKRCNKTKCENCHFYEGLSSKLFENGKTLRYDGVERFLTKEEYEQALYEELKDYFDRKKANEEETASSDDFTYRSTVE